MVEVIVVFSLSCFPVYFGLTKSELAISLSLPEISQSLVSAEGAFGSGVWF